MHQTPKSFFAFLVGVSLAAATYTQAQTFEQANQQAKADLDAALQELNDTREQIAKDKVPLLSKVSKMEDEIQQQGEELQRLRRLRDNTEGGLIRLNEQVEGLKAQNEYTAGLLDEFVRSFETRIHFAESQLYTETTKEARLALEDSNLEQDERFTKQINVIDVAIDRLDQLIGGYRFEGLALAPDGEIIDGQFGAFGPSVYFAAQSSPLTGVTVTKLNAAEAAVTNPGNAFSQGIRQFIETGEGELPIDVTLGKALKIEEGSISISERIAQGGIVGYIILVLGGVCALLGLLKLVEVISFKTPEPEKVQGILDALEQGKHSDAAQLAISIKGAGGEMMQKAVEFAGEKRGTLEEILYEKILAVRPKLERFLPFMALTAAAAPLLGLLGTVTGMIKTFNLITIFGTGDAKSLSAGISEALVTTALGLCVAIPALILHGILARMARQKVGDMEQTAVGFINGVDASHNNKAS